MIVLGEAHVNPMGKSEPFHSNGLLIHYDRPCTDVNIHYVHNRIQWRIEARVILIKLC